MNYEWPDSTGRFDSATITVIGRNDQHSDVVYSDVTITFSTIGWVRFQGKRLGALGTGARWVVFTDFYHRDRIIHISTQGEKR